MCANGYEDLTDSLFNFLLHLPFMRTYSEVWERAGEGNLTLTSSFFQQIKIVDREGNIVPVNTPGEICIRGYCVMMGYWGEKEQTESALEPTGWLHTGWDIFRDVYGWMSSYWRLATAFFVCVILKSSQDFPWHWCFDINKYICITNTLIWKKNGD